MKRSGLYGRADQIGNLKEHEAGVSVTNLCRKHDVSGASIYKWKAKSGGLKVSEAKRLRTLDAAAAAAGRRHARQRGAEGAPWKEVVTSAAKRNAVAREAVPALPCRQRATNFP